MKDFNLFGFPSEVQMRTKSTLRRKSSVSDETPIQHFLKYRVWGRLEVMGPYDVPIIHRYRVSSLPNSVIPFHEAIRSKNFNSIVHFYLNDPLFVRVFRQPEKYIGILKRFKYVITPDLSEYTDMPFYLRLGASCLNRAWAAYWQNNGIDIILNITWSLHDSYCYSFEGIPEGLVVAISSLGVKKSNFSTTMWLDGYNRALDIIKPSQIVRYGERIPGEREDISVYFENEHLNRMRNGKRRLYE